MSWYIYWHWVYPISAVAALLMEGWSYNWDWEEAWWGIIPASIPGINTVAAIVGFLANAGDWWIARQMCRDSIPPRPENTHKGFTLIEALIVIAIVGILAALLGGAINEFDGTTCRGGYKFVESYRGYVTQVMGDDGKPVKCGSAQ